MWVLTKKKKTEGIIEPTNGGGHGPLLVNNKKKDYIRRFRYYVNSVYLLDVISMCHVTLIFVSGHQRKKRHKELVSPHNFLMGNMKKQN